MQGKAGEMGNPTNLFHRELNVPNVQDPHHDCKNECVWEEKKRGNLWLQFEDAFFSHS